MTKERLQELIEQKGSLWYGNNGYVMKIAYKEYNDEYSSKKIEIKEQGLEIEVTGEDRHTSMYKFDQLFETEAEALHHAKYGNITRTEKMPVPPMWEEFLELREYSFTLNGGLYKLSDTTWEGFVISFGEGDNFKRLVRFDTTEENYELALDKMVQLFKGE